MYKALYRKYRPGVFSDVVGQEHITATLKHQLATGRLSHAYLFIGSRGTGKTTCAKIFAKAINCPHSVNGDPCGQCEICRGIDDGTITDVVEIDAASNNGVDDVRELRDEVNYTPVKAKYRVYIIDEVHMLSTSAFNALLKTLEEPPEHVKFILATTEAHKLPATILSRCQRFDFRHISPEDMLPRLQFAAEAEGATLSDDAGLLIGRLADGAMRDAMSLLDRCISSTNTVDIDTARTVAGVSDRSYLHQVAKAIANKDSESAVRIVNELYAQSVNMESFLSECLNYFRNVMVISSVKDATNLVNCAASEFPQLKAIAEEFTLPAVMLVLEELQQAYLSVKSGADRKLACELAFIKLTNPLMDKSDDAILQRLAKLEKALASGTVVSPAPAPKVEPVAEPTPVQAPVSPVEQVAEPAEVPLAEEPVEEPSPAPQPAQESGSDGDILEWPEVLATLTSKDFALGMTAAGSSASASGNTIVITTDSGTFKNMVETNSVSLQNVVSATNTVTGKNFTTVRFAGESKEDKNDPLDQLTSLAQSSGFDIDFN